MKQLRQILISLIIFSGIFQQAIFAQNWSPFPAYQKTWFEFSSSEHYSSSLYYANRIVEKGDSTLYFMDANNTLELLLTECENDESFEAEAVHFISILEPYVEVEGKYYFKNQLVFDANLKPGEGIFIQSENYVDFDEVYLECIEERTETIFGRSDEVKVFSLNAIANGQPVESSFDKHSYKLSKSYGFLQFLPFIELLSQAKTTATITGFTNDQGNLSGSKGVVGNNYRTPYEVGDVIYYSENTTIDLGLGQISKIWRDSITSVTNYGDSSSYTFNRIEHITEESVYNIVLDTLLTTLNKTETIHFNDSINPNVFKSIYGYAIEEIPQNGFVRHFSIEPSLNSFSLQKDQPTATIKVQNQTNVSSNGGCYFHTFLLYGYEVYHSQLGQINDYYRDDCCLERSWHMHIYKKGNQTYSPFTTLDSIYTTTDTPVNLLNNYHHSLNNYGENYTISGPGVSYNIFYPDAVPNNLLNVPFEITANFGIWEFKQTITVTNGEDIIDAVTEEAIFLKMFPNPNFGIFNITSAQPYTTIKIYNSYGALVFSENEPSNTLSHQLPSGVYLVEILNQNKTLAIEKLIVQ